MKRIFSFGLITLGARLGFGTLSQLYLNSRISPSLATLDLSKQLAGLTLTNFKRGTEALTGNLVIWLAADAVVVDTALQQTLEVYP